MRKQQAPLPQYMHIVALKSKTVMFMIQVSKEDLSNERKVSKGNSVSWEVGRVRSEQPQMLSCPLR